MKLISKNQKGVVSVLVIILMLAAISLGVYLIRSKHNLYSKASTTGIGSDTSYTANVLVIKYFPLDASGQNLDSTVTGVNKSLVDIRNYVNNLNADGIARMTSGSKFHGYKDPSALPAIIYQVADTKEYLQAMPISQNQVPWNPGMYRPDYMQILNNVNICNYIDNQNVKQVWLWGYHHGNVEPVEADMAMGNLSQAFWNKSGYGDVSNSEQTNDMPTCQKTYTLYNYNYGRGLGELLEDHGHQIEAVFRFVDNVLWNKFQKPNGDTNLQVVNHCGWTHSPPNSGDWAGDRGQYDWNDKTIVKSDCEDWKPEGGGVVKDTNCNNWYEPFYGISYATTLCQLDSGAAFKVWWMQNIPGKANSLFYQGKSLRNWWDFYADFDSALAIGKSLTITQPVPTSTPTPTPTPSASSIPADSVKITYPNGGESFRIGDTVRITWEANNKTAFSLGRTTGPGNLQNIAFISDPNARYYDWLIKKEDVGNMLPGASRLIKVDILAYPQEGTNWTDQSDNYFTVTNPDPSLFGYWKMDEASISADCTIYSISDSSGNNRDAKGCPETGGPISQLGKIGYGVYFDNFDYAEVQNSSNMGSLSEITVATWIKPNAYSGKYPRIISKNGSFDLHMYTWAGGEGRLEWDIRIPGETDTKTFMPHKLSLNTWYHVAATYNGSVSKVYINGVKVAERTGLSGAITSTQNPILFGAVAKNDQLRNLNATLDEVRVYTRALSDSEIASLTAQAN